MVEGRSPPGHVHVYRNGKLALKWNFDNHKVMKGHVSNKLLQLIRQNEIRRSFIKIKSVRPNNQRKTFELKTSSNSYVFPYVKADPQPVPTDSVVRVYTDKDLGREGFTYVLQSGKTGTIHVEQVVEYNRDPTYLKDLLLYRLSLEAQKRVAESRLSKREIVRRLGTSATQLYRLLDQTNHKKSLDQLVSLLQLLDFDVDVVVRKKSA